MMEKVALLADSKAVNAYLDASAIGRYSIYKLDHELLLSVEIKRTVFPVAQDESR